MLGKIGDFMKLDVFVADYSPETIFVSDGETRRSIEERVKLKLIASIAEEDSTSIDWCNKQSVKAWLERNKVSRIKFTNVSFITLQKGLFH